MKKWIFYLVLLASSLNAISQSTIPVQMTITKGPLVDTNQLKAELSKTIIKLNNRPDTNWVKAKIAAAVLTATQGAKGDTGPAGPKGDRGEKGDIGQTGPQGPPGTGTGGTVNSIISIRSVKDWGAKGDGSTDDQAAINRAIQDCYAQGIYTLYFPAGNYIHSKPILMRNKSAAFSTLRLLGETRMWSSAPGSVLIATYNDAPGIAMQLNKGSEINGFRIVGKFQPASGNSFWNTPFEQWGSGARDSRYSPECGIAVDFATNFGGVPPDGGYPTMTGEYGIATDRGTGGSTGVQIRNCVISNHVVGIASSINGQTQNEEELVIDFVDFTNCKTGVAGGQSQEKNNVLSNFATWGGTHTLFSQGVYGSVGHAGHWKIEKGNVAGQCLQLVSAWAAAWFPVFIEDVFAESLGQFGSYGTQMNAQVSNCHFDFQEPQYGIGFRPLIYAYGAVNFNNVIMRYYNGAVPGYPIIIQGGVYTQCTFGGTPVDILGTAEYYNCGEDGYGDYRRRIGDTRKNIRLTTGENIVTHNRYGDFSFKDVSHIEIPKISFQENTTYLQFSSETGTRQVTTTGGAAFTFTSSNSAAYNVNQLIEYSGDAGRGWGAISKIEGNIITVVGGTPANANYNISAIYPNHASIVFTGDVTGPGEISNIKATWGIPTGGVGRVFETQAGVFKIVSYDASTNKFKTIGKLPTGTNTFK